MTVTAVRKDLQRLARRAPGVRSATVDIKDAT